MRILVIQNDRLGPAGVLGEVAARRGAELVTVLGWGGDPVPAAPNDQDGYDGLIVLGGAMGANDADAHPYLDDVFPLIRAFAAAGRPVLGVCLGAQMIARAYGAPVMRMARREIGFTRLALTAAAAADPLLAGLAPEHQIMQSHDDTFELPDGAVALMTGAAVPNQAYRVGELVYGFQCHLEVRPAIIRDWIGVMPAAVKAAHPEFFGAVDDHIARHIDAAVAFGETVADRWLDLAAAHKKR